MNDKQRVQRDCFCRMCVENQMNIIKSDIEQSCFCCMKVTRLVLIEAHANFPMCIDCLFTYDSLIRTTEIMETRGIDRLINRHIHN